MLPKAGFPDIPAAGVAGTTLISEDSHRMPIQYERDDVRRRVVITFPGVYHAADAVAAIERHHAEGVWSYGVLYDLRILRGHPALADLKAHMAQDAQPPSGEGQSRGPVAIVTTDPIVYGSACTYAALGRSTSMTIEVFHDWTEAEGWLAANTSEMSVTGKGKRAPA
jgi:hypothetical protein